MLWGKPKTTLGVDLGAGGVKLAELKWEKGRPVLLTYALTAEGFAVHEDSLHDSVKNHRLKMKTGKLDDEAVLSAGAAPADQSFADKSAEEYGAVIRAMRKEARSLASKASVSLPSSAVFHAVVTLPRLKKEEFNRVLQAEVKKLLPLPVEDLVLDYQTLPALTGNKEDRVLINAVEKKRVAFYGKIFKNAGLELSALEPESVALSRALIGKDQGVVMLIDIGAQRTNFFIVDAGVPMTHNSIETGGDKVNRLLQNRLGLEGETAEQIKRDLFASGLFGAGGLTKERWLETLMPVIDPIVKEIDFDFELFLKQAGNEGKRPEKIVLTGGGAMLPHLTDYLAQKFSLKCYLGDPWARVVYQDALRPRLSVIGPRLAVAIGLSLKN